ncbi:single-stranded DNA-binding protein [Staphylococcus epidermidis]|uniref:single-stranded DNA-binding protein n=1 Tax=Staphylococcus epidermidis TaxID=1282 RepID=UPI0034D3DEE3
MNVTVLIGRLTRDPELKHTPNGIAVTYLNLAVNRDFKNSRGEYEADFINCLVFRKQAENVSTHLSKGSKISIRGRIQTRSYKNSEDKRIYITEVVADKVEYLDTKNKQNTNDNPFANSKQNQSINEDIYPF